MAAQSRRGQAPPWVAWLLANKQTVATSVGAAGAAYLAWKAYNSSSANQLGKLRTTVANYGSALASLSSSAALVASDLHAFLNSDMDELPQSLKQANKLLQSREVQESLTSAAASVARGVSHAMASTSDPNAQPLVDKLLEAVLSDRGRTLVGMAVGLATKNATSTLCEFLERMQRQQGGSSSSAGEGEGDMEGMGPAGVNSTMAAVVNLLASEQGERILSLLITKSIKTAVSTYVDATTGYNYYEDIMASITKQEHRDAVTDIMSRVTASFCREVAIAYKRSRSPANSTAGGLLSPASSSSSSSSVTSLAGHVGANSGRVSAGLGSGGGAHDSATSVPISISLAAGMAAGNAASCSGVDGPAMPVARRNSADSLGRFAASLVSSSLGFGGAAANPSAVAAAAGTSSGAVAGRGHHHGANHHHKANAPRPAPPVWLKQVADLAREQDIRTLVIDVVKSTTREATRSTIETLVYGGASGSGASSSSGGVTAYVRASSYHVSVLLTILISLAMYAMAPRTVVL